LGLILVTCIFSSSLVSLLPRRLPIPDENVKSYWTKGSGSGHGEDISMVVVHFELEFAYLLPSEATSN
jgi:hypothetical protein